ncbi:MAG: flagellar biosynthetic protein FliO [Proteobacteria bacterium]|nr:flagellar biosynthetic protein FliO [Pseudomonadota bacterium]
MPVARKYFPVLSLLPAICLHAGIASAQTANAPAAVSAGGYLQMVLGLVVVLALVGGAAWLLKRLSALPGTGAGMIRVIGAAAVGQRERVVLVEVGETWLLLGVAPGQVRGLHTMPKAEAALPAGADAPADQGFSIWLRRMMEKRGHG